MKGRYLFSFIVSVLGIGLLTMPQFTIATPAPIFRPILRNIQNQLPERMIMRLPTSLDITGVNGRIRIYPILEPNSRSCFGRNCFSIFLASEPDCQARACRLGSIATFRPSSDYSDIVQSLGDERYRRTSSITLREGIRGTYVYADPRGVSSGPFSVVIWNQNGQTFIVSLPFSQQEKQKIINIAISMANEPPIRSVRTSITFAQVRNNLRSDRGINYTRLRDLLAARIWREADQETKRVIIKANGQENEDFVDALRMDQFPCTDLRTIDSLWVQYSNGRFGFSVQKRIYDNVGQDFENFISRVGWVNWVNNRGAVSPTFSLNAPVGNLPCAGATTIWKWGNCGVTLASLDRIAACRLVSQTTPRPQLPTWRQVVASDSLGDITTHYNVPAEF